MENDNSFQTSERSVQTCIPSAIEMSIRKVDWIRIYRSVRSIPQPTSKILFASSFFGGVATSAGVSLIPLFQDGAELEHWVIPVFLSVAIASTVIGGVCFWFGQKHTEIIDSSSTSVTKDMEDIYQTFFPNSDLSEE